MHDVSTVSSTVSTSFTMRITSSCIALLSLYASLTRRVIALPAAYLVKESIEVPEGWVKVGRATAGHTLNLRLGLPQPNFGLLEQHLYEISDPYHERYGNHLSKEEVEELVSPHQTSLDSVDQWLASYGFRENNYTRSPAKDWITVTVPVALAETMLNTVCLHTNQFVQHHLPRSIHNRLIIYGSTLRVVTMLFERRPTVCPVTSMTISTSSNQPPYSLVGKQ
jgi:subtilase family serine protease